MTGELKRGRVAPADREHLQSWPARFTGCDDVRFALEGCTGWRHFTEELLATGITPHLAEPVDTAALRGKKRHAKTDKTDARHLPTHLLAVTCRSAGSRRCGDFGDGGTGPGGGEERDAGSPTEHGGAVISRSSPSVMTLSARGRRKPSIACMTEATVRALPLRRPARRNTSSSSSGAAAVRQLPLPLPGCQARNCRD
jgi:hypothetical protein